MNPEAEFLHKKCSIISKNLYCNLNASRSFRRGKSVAEATEDILQVQLPRLKELMSAGRLRVDNIDVFCEQGVFDLGSTRSILQAGKDMGLNINFHGDELHPMNSAQVWLTPEAVSNVFWPKDVEEEEGAALKYFLSTIFKSVDGT